MEDGAPAEAPPAEEEQPEEIPQEGESVTERPDAPDSTDEAAAEDES
jgi:hypothetical protein